MTNTTILSDKEVKELAAELAAFSDAEHGGLAAKASKALLDLLRQQDASSNYFSARMQKALQVNESRLDEINRLSDGWAEANSTVLARDLEIVDLKDQLQRAQTALAEGCMTTLNRINGA